MKLFQQTLLPDPLGTTLAGARQKKRLTLAKAARLAGISEEEASAFEEERILHPGTARVHAITYARSLGIDPALIRDALPPAPGLAPEEGGYLARMARPQGKRKRFSLDLMKAVLEPLAPLGRAAVYLLLLVALLGTWGVMRRLSRVRAIPWITGNSRPALSQGPNDR